MSILLSIVVVVVSLSTLLLVTNFETVESFQSSSSSRGRLISISSSSSTSFMKCSLLKARGVDLLDEEEEDENSNSSSKKKKKDDDKDEDTTTRPSPIDTKLDRVDDDDYYNAGMDLAKAFNARVEALEKEKTKKRQERADELRNLNRDLFSKRKEIRVNKQGRIVESSGRLKSDRNKKFTGNNPNPNSFGSLFDNNQQQDNVSPSTYKRRKRYNPQSSSSQGSSSVRNRMMRSENRLVNFAGGEQSLVIQAGAVVLALAFVLYIGLSGGITDGSERFVDDSLMMMMDDSSSSSLDLFDDGTPPPLPSSSSSSNGGSVFL